MSNDSLTRITQFICGLQGHDRLPHFERGRLSLKCTSCGHETPGWDLRKANATQTPEAPAAGRRRLLTWSLVGR
jgi:hypothetical protein